MSNSKVRYLPLFTILIANLLPIYGVYILGWNVTSIVYLYWIESAIIGLFNIPKMLLEKDLNEDSFITSDLSLKQLPFIFEKSFYSFVYLIVYGTFLYAHLLALGTFFGTFNFSVPGGQYAVAFIFLSHLLSFFFNFVLKKEYRKTAINDQMIIPFQRVIVMQLIIMFGGMYVIAFNNNTLFLLLLVLAKIVVDLIAHFKEHQKTGSYEVIQILPNRV